jgi:hypothetical protein
MGPWCLLKCVEARMVTDSSSSFNKTSSDKRFLCFLRTVKFSVRKARSSSVPLNVAKFGLMYAFQFVLL